MGRAQLDRRGAFIVRAAGDDHLESEQCSQLDRHRPDPAGPAMNQHRVALGRQTPLEQIHPDR